MSEALNQLRDEIDALDKQVVHCLNERAKRAAQIGQIKQKKGDGFYVPSREAALMKRLDAYNEGPLQSSALRHIFREVISASIALEKKLSIAYLGPEATYTQQAAIKNFGHSVHYLAASSIVEVIRSVERKEADYGVVPIENSNEGGVNHSMDALVESELSVVSEVYLPIEHCLISAAALETIETVYSKDQALGQCRDWLRAHLPNAACVPTASTAEAVAYAADPDKKAAIIASALVAEHKQLPILKRAINDKSDNTTRFWVIGRELPASNQVPVEHKTSFVVSVKDQSGALQKALEPFAARAINLSKIESRPSRKKAWDYVFFIDVAGHYQDQPIQDAVEDLKQHCSFVKLLGSYPQGKV